MRGIIEIPAEKVVPDQAGILEKQGVPTGDDTPPKIRELLDTALDTFSSAVSAKGIYSDVTSAEFADIYAGEGNNEAETPLEGIFPKAETLALFAVTVGEKVCTEIDGLFDSNEPALAYMLDAAASDGAEKAADYLEAYYYNNTPLPDDASVPGKILRYCPGYCGWHISGQGKLFDYLHPEEIGITLRPSFLMEPLKSVSGVFIIGSPEIHIFKPKYSFCRECTSHSCLDRQR